MPCLTTGHVEDATLLVAWRDDHALRGAKPSAADARHPAVAELFDGRHPKPITDARDHRRHRVLHAKRVGRAPGGRGGIVVAVGKRVGSVEQEGVTRVEPIGQQVGGLLGHQSPGGRLGTVREASPVADPLARGGEKRRDRAVDDQPAPLTDEEVRWSAGLRAAGPRVAHDLGKLVLASGGIERREEQIAPSAQEERAIVELDRQQVLLRDGCYEVAKAVADLAGPRPVSVPALTHHRQRVAGHHAGVGRPQPTVRGVDDARYVSR